MVRSPEATEKDLSIQYFCKGSPEAFKMLFFEYYSELYSFSLMLLQHRAVAQKVTMEIFFLLWNRRADFGDEKRIKAFLYLAARNRSLHQVKACPDRQPVTEDTRIDVIPGSLPVDVLRDVFSFAARAH